MKKLARKQILAMHTELIAEHGGIDGLRDEALFESALAAPFHGFGGQDLFPTTQQKAVRLGYGLIKNHPFIDGNNTKLRSIDIERCTPKFLKTPGNPAFSKTCGRRFPPPYTDYAIFDCKSV
ncbi:MAG: Fic family protein [Holophagales bacterium]|jgi:hypothetical protein|nr:Fic family protein [Holophagales bacterium]